MTLTFNCTNGMVIPFDGSEGVTILEGAEGLFEIPAELGLEQRVAYDGATLFRTRFAPRRLLLPLLIVDGGGVALSSWRTLFACLRDGGSLVYDGPGGQRTLEQVTFESVDRSLSGWDLGDEVDDVFTVSSLALDPWWYGPDQTEAMNLGAVTAFDAAVAFDSSITPFDGGDTTQVPVSGDEVAFAKFVLDGPFTTLTLSGSGTGEFITLNGPLADGSQIVIDATPSRRGPTLDGGDIQWTLITPDSRLFTLTRPYAVVSMSSTGTGGNSAVELHWRNRYLTP